MKKLILSFFLVIFAATNVYSADKHFLTDENYRTRVENDFNKRVSLIGKKFLTAPMILFDKEESEALQFLYAYMPLSDITDYSPSFYLDNVRQTFKVRNEMSWGKNIPELLFRHFVLPIRVNN